MIACKKDATNDNIKQEISLRANGILYSVTTGDANVEEAYAHIRNENKFQLNATSGLKDFSISNQNIPGVGTYNLTTGNVLNFVQWEDGAFLFSSITTSKSHLALTITRVAGNSSDYLRYVEGAFSGVLYNSGQTDSVKITEGRIKILE